MNEGMYYGIQLLALSLTISLIMLAAITFAIGEDNYLQNNPHIFLLMIAALTGVLAFVSKLSKDNLD